VILLCLGQPSSTINTSDVLEVERPRNYYKHFVSRDIEAEIIQVCQLLGYYGDIQLLVDHFLELFIKSSAYRKQAAFCLNEMISGTVKPLSAMWEHTEPKNTLCNNSANMDCIVR